jgi:hypothetical protein
VKRDRQLWAQPDETKLISVSPQRRPAQTITIRRGDVRHGPIVQSEGDAEHRVNSVLPPASIACCRERQTDNNA